MRVMLCTNIRHRVSREQPQLDADKHLYCFEGNLDTQPEIGHEIMFKETDEDHSGAVFTVTRVLHPMDGSGLEVWVNDQWSWGYASPSFEQVCSDMERIGWRPSSQFNMDYWP